MRSAELTNESANGFATIGTQDRTKSFFTKHSMHETSTAIIHNTIRCERTSFWRSELNIGRESYGNCSQISYKIKLMHFILNFSVSNSLAVTFRKLPFIYFEIDCVFVQTQNGDCPVLSSSASIRAREMDAVHRFISTKWS